MTNTNLINDAIDLVVNYFEANRILVNSSTIRTRVESWYNNSDIADAEILAAMSIEGSYKPMDYSEILAKRDEYFPEIPVEYSNFSVEEIRMAMEDAQWQ